MPNSTVEKYYKDGRNFIIVVWENERGLLHEEIFEVNKISERDISDVSVNETLTQAKGTIEVGVDAKTI